MCSLGESRHQIGTNPQACRLLNPEKVFSGAEQGTKFSMRMEDVVGEEYLGIRVFRFYFHCKACAAEITMCALHAPPVPPAYGYKIPVVCTAEDVIRD